MSKRSAPGCLQGREIPLVVTLSERSESKDLSKKKDRNMNIEQLISHAHDANASDVHLVCGLPVKFRVKGIW